MNETILLQKQIIDNSKSVHEYMRDLYEWEKDITKQDNIVKNESIKNPIQANKSIINNKENSNEENDSKAKKIKQENKNLKRDTTNMKQYYKEWDKFQDKTDEEYESELDYPSKEKNLLKNYKTSEAQPNSNILIKNRRLINSNTNNPEFFSNEDNTHTNEFDKFINLDFDYIFRMRNEANTFFAISNFNKSIELNTSILKLIENKKKNFVEILKKINKENIKNNIQTIAKFDFSDSKTGEIIKNCLNNRGNSYLRNSNYNEAINDFNSVLRRDPKNIKAYFRKGIAYYNLQIFNQALKDFKFALSYSNENEKNGIQKQIEKTLSEINTLINKQKNKSESFLISNDSSFRTAIIKDIDDDLISQFKEFYQMDLQQINTEKIDLMNLQLHYTLNQCDFFKDSLKKHEIRINQTNEKCEDKVEKIKENQMIKNKNPPNTRKCLQSPSIKKEELLKFVYDLSSQNLNASSFKYAMRNLKNDQKEKEDYLLKINPNYIPNIFLNDIDKDSLLDIFCSLKGIINRTKNFSEKDEKSQYSMLNNFAIDILRNILKINRIKLIMKLLSKKDKKIIEEIFELFDKEWDSEIISVRDSYNYL